MNLFFYLNLFVSLKAGKELAIIFDFWHRKVVRGLIIIIFHAIVSKFVNICLLITFHLKTTIRFLKVKD